MVGVWEGRVRTVSSGAIILGAFGAHALKTKLPLELMSAYETAVQYQLWHSLAILVLCGFLTISANAKLLQSSGYLFSIGIVLFSGSLYIIATTSLRYIGPLPIGVLTPIGGLCFIAAWMLMAVHFFKQ